MKILIVTDAWTPHGHAMVTSLGELVRELQAENHEVQILHPGMFRHFAGPSWLGMDIALLPERPLRRLMQQAGADAVHIATEGPLGWAARRVCRAHGWGFTTSWWLRLPQRLQRHLRVPTRWTAALLRRFHRPASRVLATSQAQADGLNAAGVPQARAWVPGVDARLFAPLREADGQFHPGAIGPLAHPVSLYVGTVALDQRIEDFLRLDVPGSKLVCGAGPDKSALRQRYPNVHWLGFLPRPALAQVYAAADVLVCPGRGEDAPPPVLEAQACGTPVAAYPTAALVDLIGQSRTAALQTDLREAWHEALRIPRHEARAGALRFAWSRAAVRFVAELHPLRDLRPMPAPALRTVAKAANAASRLAA